MTKETFESSIISGPHHQLSQLIGTWEGMTKTFFEPNVLADESAWNGTIKPILNGMFMVHEYKGSVQGNPLEGVAIYGYNIGTGKFQSAWVDSFHNGTSIMFSQKTKTDRTFDVLGSYDAPDGSPSWGWQTEIDIIEKDMIVISMYNITPANEKAKAVETTYRRKK